MTAITLRVLHGDHVRIDIDHDGALIHREVVFDWDAVLDVLPDICAEFTCLDVSVVVRVRSTRPCPACGGDLQQHATAAGLLQQPTVYDGGYLVRDMRREATDFAPAVIWTCNGCEVCVRE